MKSVTNAARGPRGFNLKHDPLKGEEASVVLAPGETRDCVPAEDDVFKALVKAGDLVLGKPGERPQSPADAAASREAEIEQRIQDAEEAGYQRGLAEGKKVKA